jgi:serine/threonine-protein kinase
VVQAERSVLAFVPSPEVVLAGRYRLECPIAAGGVGEVWRAADQVLARPVAVKMLRAAYAGDPETRARFRQEARNAGCLSHPGIAQVYDYGEAGPSGAPYLVMELVEGRSLAEVLAAGPLGPAWVMDLIAQVAAALDAIHAAGMVHRDIKPGNLLLRPDGQVKITDFGIAHVAWSVPVTGSDTLIGTPAYLAPERAAGGSTIPASDLYSLGVVGYECLAGAPPFHGPSAEVAAAHRHRPLPPLPDGVPAAAAALIGELTAKDPGARPSPAGVVAQRAAQLAVALGGGTRAGTRAWRVPSAAAPAAGGVTLTDMLVTSPGGQPGQDRPRARLPWIRHRLMLALAVALAVIALGGWLLASAATLDTPRQAANPPAPAAHRPPVPLPAAAHRAAKPGAEHQDNGQGGDGNRDGGGHDGGGGGSDGGGGSSDGGGGSSDGGGGSS